MKTNAFRVIAVFALCASCSACHAYLTDEYAGKFILTAEQIGANTWSYALTNNHEWIDVIDFTLHWNPTDPVDDKNQALASFDSVTGYIPPIPTGWIDVANHNPRFYAYGGAGVMHGGHTVGGFKLRFTEGAALPGWFVIGYWQNGNYKSSTMLPVPEPSGLLAIFTGAIGLAGWIRRRRR